MEKIFNNSAFQHLAENIFLNLNYEALEECSNINQSCKEILENPLFWLKLFIRRGLSKKNRTDWSRAIKLVKNTDLEKKISSYLKRSSKNHRVVDIPCYINKDTIRKFRKMSKLNDKEFKNLDYWKQIPYGCIQLSNPDISKDQGFRSLMRTAAWIKNSDELTLELVKILAPLIDNPNAAVTNNALESPIHIAAAQGHTDFVKILAPLAKNPNNPNRHGESSIYIAVLDGHTEIVKTLIPLTENPNARSWKLKETPFEAATKEGHTEIAKILEPFK